jgi:hypothetical protein
MATEVAVAMIVTIMPTWPVIERTIVRAVDWSVVAIPVIGIAVAVIGSVMVINAAQYQGRCNARANSPAPSMTMRLPPICGVFWAAAFR